MLLVDLLDLWLMHLKVVYFHVNFLFQLNSLFVLDLAILKHLDNVVIFMD